MGIVLRHLFRSGRPGLTYGPLNQFQDFEREITQTAPWSAQGLVYAMVRREPSERPTAQEALASAWCRQFYDAAFCALATTEEDGLTWSSTTTAYSDESMETEYDQTTDSFTSKPVIVKGEGTALSDCRPTKIGKNRKKTDSTFDMKAMEVCLKRVVALMDKQEERQQLEAQLAEQVKYGGQWVPGCVVS